MLDPKKAGQASIIMQHALMLVIFQTTKLTKAQMMGVPEPLYPLFGVQNSDEWDFGLQEAMNYMAKVQRQSEMMGQSEGADPLHLLEDLADRIVAALQPVMLDDGSVVDAFLEELRQD